MKLREYIKQRHNDNQRDFARHMGVLPQAVTKWLNDDWIVIDDVLYTPRRNVLTGDKL